MKPAITPSKKLTPVPAPKVKTLKPAAKVVPGAPRVLPPNTPGVR